MGRRSALLSLLALAVAGPLAGCGGSQKLSWQGQPRLFIPAALPGDRILMATVKNTGSKPINVKVPDLRVVDGQGRQVRASAAFIRAYAHGIIFPDLKRRDEQPLVEQRRIGQQILLRPGRTAPLMVSWHQPRDAAPAKVDYGKGTLKLPADSTATPSRG
ncbi:MAG: hypothetical protein ABI950_11595 [Solirubrobacteraceae bacterium]